ncbi:MAG: hypothetical protein ACLP0J_20165 [Solirubrobacteraceae bacterium]
MSTHARHTTDASVAYHETTAQTTPSGMGFISYHRAGVTKRQARRRHARVTADRRMRRRTSNPGTTN